LPARLRVYADPDTLRAAAEALGLPLAIRAADQDAGPGELAVEPVPLALPARFGHPDPRNAAAVIEGLRRAAAACDGGVCAGLVTGPVHKASIQAGGIAYTGTTELLGEWTGSRVVMMLATVGVPRGLRKPLRVALATTHLPLRAVPDAIEGAGLEACLRIVHRALRAQFGVAAPCIAVLGLNPHAGEDGLLGREEIEVIAPVLARLRAEGMDLDGPLPADTAFLQRRLDRYDALLAMYHDQGLPVLKYAGFEQAVNLTLGLPWPRVAVDHGTALDLAGSGRADDSSLRAAVELCARLARTATG
jgi:4-hydroxythreonine-4-phosphate dehydrogenase